MNRSRWVSIGVVIALAVSFLAIGKAPVYGLEAVSKASVGTVVMTSDAKHTAKIGQPFTIDLGGKTAKGYTSSAPEIAKVSRKGKVTPLTAGKATITVKFPDKTKWKLKLTVVDPTMPTKVTLNYKGKVTIDQNESLKLKATLSPKTAVSGISWKSSDKTVATVKKGLVTPLKTGTVTITASTKRGKKTASVTVEIVDKHLPTSVRIDQGKKVTMEVKTTLQLSVTAVSELLPTVTTYTWKSSDKAVATVSKKGLVKAKKKGTAKITVKTSNGKKAKIKVEVVDPLSPTPTPTILPAATPTATPIPTATPTLAATPTASPIITVTPTVVLTPEPIATPTPLPAVTATPVPTSTPKPTQAPATPIPTPTAAPTPTPEPVVTGGGQSPQVQENETSMMTDF